MVDAVHVCALCCVGCLLRVKDNNGTQVLAPPRSYQHHRVSMHGVSYMSLSKDFVVCKKRGIQHRELTHWMPKGTHEVLIYHSSNQFIIQLRKLRTNIDTVKSTYDVDLSIYMHRNYMDKPQHCFFLTQQPTLFFTNGTPLIIFYQIIIL